MLKIIEFEDYPGYYRSVVMGKDFVLLKDGYDLIRFSFEEFEKIIETFRGKKNE